MSWRYARKWFHMPGAVLFGLKVFSHCFFVFERTTTRTNFNHLRLDGSNIRNDKDTKRMDENNYYSSVIVNATVRLGWLTDSFIGFKVEATDRPWGTHYGWVRVNLSRLWSFRYTSSSVREHLCTQSRQWDSDDWKWDAIQVERERQKQCFPSFHERVEEVADYKRRSRKH